MHGKKEIKVTSLGGGAQGQARETAESELAEAWGKISGADGMDDGFRRKTHQMCDDDVDLINAYRCLSR